MRGHRMPNILGMEHIVLGIASARLLRTPTHVSILQVFGKVSRASDGSGREQSKDATIEMSLRLVVSLQVRNSGVCEPS